MLNRLERILASPTLSLGGLAVLVGLTSGIGVWIFKQLIDWTQFALFETAKIWELWGIALVPVLGGLIVGLIRQYLIGDEKTHGTAGIMQAVALAGGRLHYQQAPAKTLTAALSIGSGASVGPEDPSVQIGANLGSFFGQIFHMSEERTRTLVAAGAASAIAAAFNAPIAGVFFALEIILGEIGGAALGMVLVSAVTSSVFTQAVSGSQPAFQIPTYAFFSAWELPLYLMLGLLAGPVSAIYVRLLYLVQDIFQSWKVPQWVKTANAGAMVGGVGFFLPQIFGVGYETIGEILNRGDLSFGILLALLIAKLVLTPVSIGGGFFGGVFAPSLFIGATLGGAFGGIAASVFPWLGLEPAAFALVGMAAVLAGAVHAPLTAALLLFEMTGDYRIILPLMFSVAVSLLTSQRLQRDSVYAMGLARHGIRLDRGRDVEALATFTVGEVMRTGVDVLPEDISLDEAGQILARSRRHGLPVVNGNGELVGILTLQDIDRAEQLGMKDGRVSSACTRQLLTVKPDDSLAVALRLMSQRDLGRLPVVAPDNPRKLVGILRRADVIHAYDVALTRRTVQRHREQAVKLDAFTPQKVDIVEIMVEPEAFVAGKLLREVPFPRQCVIASVRRGAEVFIPDGESRILPGDLLLVVATWDGRAEVNRLCRPES